MATAHVKFKGPCLRPDGRLWPPGSVVSLDEDMAKQAVKLGKGMMHPGPEFEAPAPDHPHGTRADGTPIIVRRIPGYDDPERADLGNRLAQAERAVAKPQAATR